MLCFWGPDVCGSWRRGSSAGSVESRERVFAAASLVCGRSSLGSEQLVARNEGTHKAGAPLSLGHLGAPCLRE